MPSTIDFLLGDHALDALLKKMKGSTPPHQ
jgi:hypothetical protein